MVQASPNPVILDVSSAQSDVSAIGLRLLAGDTHQAVVSGLIESGMERPDAQRRVAEAAENPLVAAGLAHAHHAAKLASLLQAFARQLSQSPVAETVPIETGLSPADFYERYYFANRPVVIKGLMTDWPALANWSPEYFRERFSDEVLEVSAERNGDPRFEERFHEHRRAMTMRELIDAISRGSGNDVYLVAKNRLLEHPPFSALLEQISNPPGFLTTGPDAPSARMWLGGAGTVTPLHHDASNIFFGQVYGRKLIRLIPPYEIENVYNARTCFSEVDLDDVDYGRFPLFRRVTVVQAIVNPGDFLLLPVGWWHQVRALQISISLSFQNFAVPGGPVVWEYPLNPFRY